MNSATLSIDISILIPVPRPQPFSWPYAINISTSGHMALNQRLYDEIVKSNPTLTFDFQQTPDHKVLVLRYADPGNYKFPKGGRIKNTGFSRSLVESGIPLPAHYEVAWNEGMDAWVGTLSKVQTTSGRSALVRSIQSSAPKTRKGGAK